MNIFPDSKVHGPTWGPPGSCRPQMGPMLAPWTLLSGLVCHWSNIQCHESHSYNPRISGVYFRLVITDLSPHPRWSTSSEWGPRNNMVYINNTNLLRVAISPSKIATYCSLFITCHINYQTVHDHSSTLLIHILVWYVLIDNIFGTANCLVLNRVPRNNDVPLKSIKTKGNDVD